ncbi:MAG TPA: adenylosuccinate synthetase, partial [Actinomycetes bacterium]|nr:adenylosuccinate synthetase [Actinomycetes bacterium]
MPGTILVGSQWGDEGKGKATDLLADKMDVVVRYQGGNNAGHTVIVGGRTFKLHLVPSGILYPHVTPVIGNGMAVDPATLLAELAALDAQGIATGKLLISANAHLIMPWHKELDKLTERWLG